MTVVACIPARGGSKGIKGKNLRMLGNLSLLARCIRVAQESKRIERLFVSTDSVALGLEGMNNDCEVVMRPPELAADDVLPDHAILHGIDELGIDASVVLRLNCTAPFTTPGDMDRCAQAVQESLMERSACTVLPFTHYLLDDSGKMVNRARETPRQEMAPQWVLNGGVSAGPIATLRRLGNVVDYERRPVPVEADCPFYCEIDTLEDLALAGALLGLTNVNSSL